MRIVNKVTHLDDFVNAAAGLLENGLHSLARCLGLVGDASLDQVAVLVSGDLTRHVDLAVDLDGLALEKSTCQNRGHNYPSNQPPSCLRHGAHGRDHAVQRC